MYVPKKFTTVLSSGTFSRIALLDPLDYSAILNPYASALSIRSAKIGEIYVGVYTLFNNYLSDPG